MPVDGTGLNFGFLFQHRDKGHPVDVLLWAFLQSRHGQQSWIEIWADDRHSAFGTWFNFAWPLENQRYAYPSFIKTALISSKGKMRSDPAVAAIIGSENDDRPFRKLQCIQFFQHLSHGLIHTFDHCGISRVAVMFRLGFVLVLGDEVLLCL